MKINFNQLRQDILRAPMVPYSYIENGDGASCFMGRLVSSVTDRHQAAHFFRTMYVEHPASIGLSVEEDVRFVYRHFKNRLQARYGEGFTEDICWELFRLNDTVMDREDWRMDSSLRQQRYIQRLVEMEMQPELFNA